MGSRKTLPGRTWIPGASRGSTVICSGGGLQEPSLPEFLVDGNGNHMILRVFIVFGKCWIRVYLTKMSSKNQNPDKESENDNG